MKFPDKEPGDDLEASHINDLNDVARRSGPSQGSYGFGTTSPSNAWSNPRPHYQRTFEIVQKLEDTLGSAYAGLYRVRPRWWSPLESVRREEWKNDNDDATPYHNLLDLDALGIGSEYEVGDYVVAQWDSQRGMLVPVAQRYPPPTVDYSLIASVPYLGYPLCAREAYYALEAYSGGWFQVNGRYGTASISSCEVSEVSGTLVYTFSETAAENVDTVFRYRVNASHTTSASTSLTLYAGLRIQAVWPQGVANTDQDWGVFGSSLSPSSLVVQGNVNAGNNVEIGVPEIVYDVGAQEFWITVPKGTTWTFRAELFADFVVSSLSSSSSTSSSSISTSSTSSSSTSSSSSSTSSSSSSTSSSSTSSSSSSISTSSSSISTSSQSDTSSSSSSAYNCHMMVSDVTFNTETCVLTVCYKELCFGKDLDISVSSEIC